MYLNSGHFFRKRVLYVVESTSYVTHCRAFFRIHLSSGVTSLTTIISKEAWQEACKSYQVFVVPACIFNQMLSNRLLEVNEIDVFIFNDSIDPLPEHISKEVHLPYHFFVSFVCFITELLLFRTP